MPWWSQLESPIVASTAWWWTIVASEYPLSERLQKDGLDWRQLGPQQLPTLKLNQRSLHSQRSRKVTIIVGEHPRTSTILANFLMVDAPSGINRIIRRLLLMALKAATSIYHLTMKFPTAKGTCEVQGNHYDSRECYNKSLRIAKKITYHQGQAWGK